MSNILIMGEEGLLPLHRHFISITCLDSGPLALKKTDGSPVLYNFSGFVVEIQGNWFAVTAGHIFDELDVALKHGSILTNWQIDDCAVSNHRLPPVPFPLDVHKDVIHTNKRLDQGMDYAAYHLNALVVKALSERGVVPIKPEQWGDDGLEDLPHWLIVGVPREISRLEFQRDAITTDNIVTLQVEKQIATIPIEQCEPPAHIPKKEFVNYYAKIRFDLIESEFGEFNIDGISGGPVFAAAIGQTLISDYRLLGVQSAAVGNVVCICPAKPFLDHLAVMVQEIISRNSKD